MSLPDVKPLMWVTIEIGLHGENLDQRSPTACLALFANVETRDLRTDKKLTVHMHCGDTLVVEMDDKVRYPYSLRLLLADAASKVSQ